MINIDEARALQNAMQSQGKRLLEKHNIIEELSVLGDVEADGSYVYDLMVKPDIDFHIYVTEYNLESVAEVAKRIILQPGITKVNIGNWVMERPYKPGMPKGFYLGINAYFEDVMWNFDIWVIKEEDKKDQENFPRGWWNKINQEHKNTMLLLKYNLQELGRYGNGEQGAYGSAEVYRAVMNDGVTSIEQLDEWRKTHPFY